MKVMFVIHGLGPGGAERVLSMLANYLVSNGYEVVILIMSKEEPFYELNKSIRIIKIIKKSNGSLFDKIKININRIYEIYKVFKTNDIDIIISFITLMNIYSTVAAKFARKKIILSEHTNFDVSKNTYLGFLRKLIYPYANAVVVLTEKDKEKYNFLNNIYVIHNPLILSNQFDKIKREKIILGVGRLMKVKGFDMLIEAYKNLNISDWKLIIVGEGPERKNLESLVFSLGLEKNITLPGVTKEIEKYYKSSSIFVLSSRAEGFPGALCEAMGYGCPAIAFDCLTGPSEIITNGFDGILVEPSNIDSLCLSIKDLIHDEKKRDILSQNSKNISIRLNINKIAKKWIDIMEKI